MQKTTLEQFIDQYIGTSPDFDGWYGAQCVDLFNFYNRDVVGAPHLPTSATNGARDLFEVDSSAQRGYYEKLSTDTELQAGDVLVYGDPQGRAIVNGKQIFYGHVNIYIGDNKVIQCNKNNNGIVTIDPVFKNGLIGILRPKSFEINIVPQNVPDQTKNKNKHTIVAGDTFWGLEERYNLSHGTLQTLNPELNPKTLRIGSDIIISREEQHITVVSPTYYTIQAGDTFYGLEDAWQLEHGTLQSLNEGQNPRTLQIGQSIRRS